MGSPFLETFENLTGHGHDQPSWKLVLACFGRKVGLDGLQQSLPTQFFPWFCNYNTMLPGHQMKGLVFCHNWLNTGYVCLHRVSLGRCPCLLAGAASFIMAVLNPGVPESRGDGLQSVTLCCTPLPAHTEQGLQLRSEALIQPTVNEGIVASAAHGKPVKSKVQSIATVDGPTGDQHHIAVQGEPADCKHNHHHHQHLQCHLLFPLMGIVLLHGEVPDGISQPELLGHHGICDGDHKQGQDIQENKSSQVQILPEKISRRREAGEADHSYCSVSEDHREKELSIPLPAAHNTRRTNILDVFTGFSKGIDSRTHSVT